MTKEEIDKEFNLVLSSPLGYKDGGYLLEKILKQAITIVQDNRKELISIFKEWLQIEREPYISLSLAIISELKFKELKSEVEHLRRKLDKGDLQLTAKRIYLEDIDRVLKAIS